MDPELEAPEDLLPFLPARIFSPRSSCSCSQCSRLERPLVSLIGAWEPETCLHLGSAGK